MAQEYSVPRRHWGLESCIPGYARFEAYDFHIQWASALTTKGYKMTSDQCENQRSTDFMTLGVEVPNLGLSNSQGEQSRIYITDWLRPISINLAIHEQS